MCQRVMSLSLFIGFVVLVIASPVWPCRVGWFTIKGESTCRECPWCPPGEGANKNCLSTIPYDRNKIPRCLPCIKGKTYSKYNSKDVCDDCSTIAPKHHVVVKCNETHNRETECIRGYFEDRATNDCDQQCCYYKGQTAPVTKCVKDKMGKRLYAPTRKDGKCDIRKTTTTTTTTPPASTTSTAGTPESESTTSSRPTSSSPTTRNANPTTLRRRTSIPTRPTPISSSTTPRPTSQTAIVNVGTIVAIILSVTFLVIILAIIVWRLIRRRGEAGKTPHLLNGSCSLPTYQSTDDTDYACICVPGVTIRRFIRAVSNSVRSSATSTRRTSIDQEDGAELLTREPTEPTVPGTREPGNQGTDGWNGMNSQEPFLPPTIRPAHQSPAPAPAPALIQPPSPNHAPTAGPAIALVPTPAPDPAPTPALSQTPSPGPGPGPAPGLTETTGTSRAPAPAAASTPTPAPAPAPDLSPAPRPSPPPAPTPSANPSPNPTPTGTLEAPRTTPDRTLPSQEPSRRCPGCSMCSALRTNSGSSSRGQAIRLSGLGYGHRKELAWMLDVRGDTNKQNWYELGLFFASSDESFKAHVNKCHGCYYGGGSSTKSMFVILSMTNPRLTMLKFRQTAERLGRKDVVDYLTKNNFPNEYLKDIDELQRTVIENLLEKRTEGENDWRDFAHEFGFTCDYIAHFEDQKKVPQKWSPTLELIMILLAHKPDITIAELKTAAMSIDRPDVSDCLEKLAQDISSQVSQDHRISMDIS